MWCMKWRMINLRFRFEVKGKNFHKAIKKIIMKECKE